MLLLFCTVKGRSALRSTNQLQSLADKKKKQRGKFDSQFNLEECFDVSYLLNVVFVGYNGSIIEKRMIEGIRKQPEKLHNTALVFRAPAVLQAEADEAQTTNSNTEEQQIVLLITLIPASLCNTVGRPITYDAFHQNHCISSNSTKIDTKYIFYLFIQYKWTIVKWLSNIKN